MPIDVRRLAINPYGDKYLDDDSKKAVVLEAEGLEAINPDDRHVHLRWTNGTDNEGKCYTQIIHLTGNPGNYNFYTPQVRMQPKASKQLDTLFHLGQYDRHQRDQIVALAKTIRFDKKSRVNSCRTWMRDLLGKLVDAELLSLFKFNEIDVGVPLKKRVPESTTVSAFGSISITSV